MEIKKSPLLIPQQKKGPSDLTDLQIALTLQEQYQRAAQCQQNIWAINQELQKRIGNENEPAD